MTSLQKHIAKEYGKPFEEVIRELYVDKRMTMEQMAKELDVNMRTVQRWLKECNIQTRKMIWA